MAERGQQGTGKHPHKSAAEPYPHTKATAGGDTRARGGGKNEMRAGSGGAAKTEARSQRARTDRDDGRARTTDSADLKSREYRGDDGQVHHHTRTYMQQHRDGR